MALMLTCGQIVQALKTNNSERAAEFELALAELTVRAAQQLTAEVPELRMARESLPDVWDGELMLGIVPTGGDYDAPIPECVQGLDDEGWA